MLHEPSVWRRISACLSVGLWCWSAACGGQRVSSAGGRDLQLAAAHPDVVSRVNGSAITTAEVGSLARVGRLSAQDALRRLEAERLLAEEARARGYDRLAHTQEVAEQALVQALLARDVESLAPSDAALESAYAEQRARFTKSEERRSTHVLAVLDAKADRAREQAAKAFIEQAISVLRATPDLQAAIAIIRAKAPPELELKVEDLPPVPSEGKFVPEFSQALFSLPGTGVVPSPVRTQFGYHAIVVTEILPGSETPKPEALDVLRGELGTSMHQKQLASLLEGLRQRTQVAYTPQVEKLLADLELQGD